MYLKYRKQVEGELNQRYKSTLRNTMESQEANEVSYPLLWYFHRLPFDVNSARLLTR